MKIVPTIAYGSNPANHVYSYTVYPMLTEYDDHKTHKDRHVCLQVIPDGTQGIWTDHYSIVPNNIKLNTPIKIEKFQEGMTKAIDLMAKLILSENKRYT